MHQGRRVTLLNVESLFARSQYRVSVQVTSPGYRRRQACSRPARRR
jgi:hypothetical protein